MICDMAYNLEAHPGPIFSPHKSVMWNLEASSAQTLRTDLYCWEIKKIYIFACSDSGHFYESERVGDILRTVMS